MDIIVCVKQVPDTNEVSLDPVKGTLIRDGVPSIINPEDKHALEAALRLKEEKGGTVTVISMGPPQADVALRETLAMGADRAILISDRAFAGSDTLATSYALSEAIRKIGKFDLIFCGRQAIDGDTAQVGPQIAEHLDIPQVTYVEDFTINGDEVVVKRALEDGYEMIKTRLPLVLTAIKELNEVRYPSIGGIFSAYREKEVELWTADTIGIKHRERLGLDGSPTKVKKVFTPEAKGQGQMVEGSTVEEKVKNLLDKLSAKKII